MSKEIWEYRELKDMSDAEVVSFVNMLLHSDKNSLETRSGYSKTKDWRPFRKENYSVRELLAFPKLYPKRAFRIAIMTRKTGEDDGQTNTSQDNDWEHSGGGICTEC